MDIWVKDGLTMHLWNFGVKILIMFLLMSQLLCKTQGCWYCRWSVGWLVRWLGEWVGGWMG